MKKQLKQRLMVGAGLLMSAGAAFAQASGTTAINDSGIVSNITSVVTNVVDIGAAVLSVVVVAWGYKTVKGFIGR